MAIPPENTFKNILDKLRNVLRTEFKGANKLKETEVVQNEVITGDYQQLSSGLQVRFAGSSNAALNDEWEIEVFGAFEDIDASSGKAVKMTRVRKHGRIY